jgi:uncharacterized protein YjiS (DUF1127 family)
MFMIITHNLPARRLSRSLTFLTAAAFIPVTLMRRIRARRELMRLLSQPDYLLKDVGLQRDAITREGMKRFWMS